MRDQEVFTGNYISVVLLCCGLLEYSLSICLFHLLLVVVVVRVGV